MDDEPNEHLVEMMKLHEEINAMRGRSISYKIVKDTIGPHAGQWIVEDEDRRIIEGPFDTKRDAKEYLATRENWRRSYASSVAPTRNTR